MAKQVVNIGTTANDGTGDPLRSAFDKINDNFTELYDDDAGDVGSIIAGTGISVDQATGDVTVTNDAPDQTVSLTGGLGISTSGTYPNFTITNTSPDQTLTLSGNDISIVGSYPNFTLTNDEPNATHTGDVTGATALTIANDAVNGDKIADDSIDSEHYVDGSIDLVHLSADSVDGTKIADDSIDSEHYVDGSIDTAHIANDQVTHDKLENRYTAEASITTLTGTVTFDCSAGTVFKLSGDITGTYTIDLSNYKQGQVITIYPVSGDQTLNLDAQGSSTNTFNKIGGTDYDGTSDNIIQIECVDDSATDPIFFYSIATFAAGSSGI
jgi:hypothetical protein